MPKALPRVHPLPRSGDNPFRDGPAVTSLYLKDFWSWALSDLLVNTNRGLLAEFLVSRALEEDTAVREPWRPFDVLSSDGLRVEVKSGAYLQAWAQDRLTDVYFSVGMTRAWDPDTGLWSETRERQSDAYVFCLLKLEDKTAIEPADLSQWEFFVVSTKLLNTAMGSVKTLSLARLKTLCPDPVAWTDLSRAVRVKTQEVT